MSKAELDFASRIRGTDAVKPTAPSEGSSIERELVKRDSEFSTPVTLRNLFTHHETHPVVIDLSLLRVFGDEWLGWEPETIWAEIQRVFQTQISEHARAKVQCVKTLRSVDSPWNSWPVFEKVIQVLNGNLPDWEVMQAPSIEMLYAGIDMLDQIRKVEFSDEVKHYMAAAVLTEDVFFVPPPLDFLQAEVAQPYYHCNDCGNENPALFHDGLCDSCTQKFESGNVLTVPDPELVSAGRGKNLDLRMKFDPDPVERRWKQVSSLPSSSVKLEENPVDVQVDRLLVARDYMNIRRRQLVEQITSLKGWLGSGR